MRNTRVVERLLTVISMGMMCSALLMGLAIEAEAHAVISSSEPADGEELQQSPAQVVLTFTEEIDVGVSSIQVLDTSGRSVASTKIELDEADPKKLSVALAELEEGVYTVTWRVLSRVDGHVTGGAFAFGVGVSPAGAEIVATEVSETPDATVLSVTSRVLIYLGLILIFGAAISVVSIFAAVSRGVFAAALFGCIALVIGIGLLAESLSADTEATYALLLRTNAGRGIIWRFAIVALTGLAVIATRRRQGFWWVVIAGAVAISATHVFFGHAGAGTLRAGKIVIQVIHISAIAVWIGGLATLLLGIRSLESHERSRVVKRFSTTAGLALGAVVITGGLRAFNEIGSWEKITTTGYGRAVLIKAVLLIFIALLGAVNRYRNVARAGETTRGLRRVGTAELLVALIVLVVTGVLTSLAPARLVASNASAAKPATIFTEGADFATTVRARLEVTPGRPGPNIFTLRLIDFDSMKPIVASRVTLSFRYPVPDRIQPSTLELKPETPGVYRSTGPNIAIVGPWLVDVLIVRANTSTQLTLTVATVSDQKDEVVPGDPILHNVTNAFEGSVQLYVDPANSGRNEVHVTYFDEHGTELSGFANAILIATPSRGDPRILAVRFLSPGHFVADGELPKGRWRFDAIADRADGRSISVYFEQDILGGAGE